jgi:hypothetical protein
MPLLDYIKNRLQERSTRLGLATAIAATLSAYNPEQVELILTIIASIIGLIEAGTPDK